MAMPASGAISFSQLQTEYGGANPININEYYSSGTAAKNTTTNRVPGSYNAVTAAWMQYTYSASFSVIRYSAGLYGPLDQWTFGGTQIYFAAGPQTSIVVSGTSYYIGGYSGNQTYTAANPKTGSPAFYTTYYGIQRYENVSTYTLVNPGVPTSGTISMSQYYNSQNY
tara:strand:+ start:651 stop:1154 length:504 start_codon:yes stop_codon:yes gene_type:complete